MTIIATLGWAVVHSLWQGTLVAGIAALALSLLPDRRARVRCWVAGASLVAMVLLPVITAISAADILDHASRRQALTLIETAVPLPQILQWRAWLVPTFGSLWLAGVALCALRISGEWRRVRRLREAGLGDAGAEVREMVDGLRVRLSIDGTVNVFRSTLAGVPMVIGWRQPRILLPTGSFGRLNAGEMRAIVAHELAHVRRRDYLANLLQVAADALLFYHPAARWASRRLRVEREYCCDDVAVEIGDGAERYARALAQLEEARGECRLAVASASGTLLDRVQRIVGEPRPTLTPGRGAIALIAAALVAAILLAVAAAVPPSLPLDTRARMRGPAPAGPALQVPRGSLPRKQPG